jgi:hypothetical protein
VGDGVLVLYVYSGADAERRAGCGGTWAFDKSTKGDERENLINCLCRESVYANPLWYVQSQRVRSLAGWLSDQFIVTLLKIYRERAGGKYLGCGARG